MDVGRVAFVTGGSGDIGAAICRALAEAGCDVALSYSANAEAAEATADEVRALGRAARPIALDQRDPASIERAAGDLIEHFGRCDILVNNAGWNVGVPFHELERLDPATWDRVLETNLRGPFLLCRALAPHLKLGGGGSVVNVASVGGLVPASSSIAYSCSKAGLIHLTHCLAVALGPEVAVNCIAPGLVEGTRMALRVPEQVAEAARQGTVLKTGASSRDIADAVLLLCRSTTITGQTLVIDGGLPHAMNFG